MALAMPASRSLIALLVGTVVFFALWMFALKGSSSTPGGSGSSKGGALGQYQSDISAAHKAVATSNASNAASGNENATSSGGASASANSTAKPSAGSTPQTQSQPSPPVTTAEAHRHSAAATLATVQAAVKSQKVVALLFYNPAAPDDQAVKQELAAVPVHKGAVVKLTVPLSEAASFTAVTQQVPLNFSPTLVLISKTDQASEIVGYSTPFEIDQRVLDALT